MNWTRREFMTTSAMAAASCAFLGCASSAKKPEIVTAPAPILPTTHDANGYFFRNFGITPALIDQVLAKTLSRGGQWGDLFFEHSFSGGLILREGKISNAISTIELGMGARCVYDNDKVGYSYTELLTPESMMQAADAAAHIAPGVNVTPGAVLTRQNVNFEHFYSHDVSWENPDYLRLLALLRDIEKRTWAKHPSITQVSCMCTWHQRNTMTCTSDGFVSEDFIPYIVLGLSIIMERNGVRQPYRDGFGLTDGLEGIADSRIDALIDSVVTSADRLFDAIKPKGGEMPVVLAGGYGGTILHEAIGHGLEADFIKNQESIYTQQLGQTITHPDVTIVDSGCVPKIRGTLSVDDEATPTERTVLVQNGVLQGFMHDKISAKHFGVKPTGNARRQSYRFPPIPRMRVTYMENGTHAPEELLEGISYGIYCQNLTNGQVNIGPGDYAFYVQTGYLIEDGKLTAPIKGVNIVGNGPDSLKKVTMVANDLKIEECSGYCGKNYQRIPVSFGIPSIRISSITVGGV